MNLFLRPLSAALFFSATTAYAGSHSQGGYPSDYTENRTVSEIAEDITSSGTVDDFIFSWSVLTENLTANLENVSEGIGTVEKFSDLIGDAGAALGGDARELGRIQRMIEKDVERLNGLHKYESQPFVLPVPITRRIESEDSDLAMGEYARVEKIAGNQITEVNRELVILEGAEQRMGEVVEAAKVATDNGVKLEKVMEEIVYSGLGVFSTAQDAWFDMALYVNPVLSNRETAAKDALKRIRERKIFLQEQGARLQKTKDWMNAFWWYELLRAQNQSNSSAGSDALNTAIGTQSETASTATTGITTNLIATRVNNQRTQELVAALLADAAKADNEAAKHAKMMQILALANAAGRGVQSVSAPPDADSSDSGADSHSIEGGTPSTPTQAPLSPEPVDVPLPVDPGNGVPIGGSDLTLNALPEGMQSVRQMLSTRYGIPDSSQ